MTTVRQWSSLIQSFVFLGMALWYGSDEKWGWALLCAICALWTNYRSQNP